jgi:hypothetical protein
MVASSHVLSFNPRWKVPNGYISVGWLLFLQEQIKDIIIETLNESQAQQTRGLQDPGISKEGRRQCGVLTVK